MAAPEPQSLKGVTDSGHENLAKLFYQVWPNHLWPTPILATPCFCFQGLVGAVRVGPGRVGLSKGGEPKISRFFHLPQQFSFFLPSLGGLLIEFGWCLKRGALKCAHLEFSGCRVKPGPKSRRRVVLCFVFCVLFGIGLPGGCRTQKNGAAKGGVPKGTWPIRLRPIRPFFNSGQKKNLMEIFSTEVNRGHRPVDFGQIYCFFVLANFPQRKTQLP